MKFFDKLTKKFASKASNAVKCEVKKTALDLLPKAIGVLGIVLGIVIFKNTDNDDGYGEKPSYSTVNTTVNNYFFNDLSEDSIMKIIRDSEDE